MENYEDMARAEWEIEQNAKDEYEAMMQANAEAEAEAQQMLTEAEYEMEINKQKISVIMPIYFDPKDEYAWIYLKQAIYSVEAASMEIKNMVELIIVIDAINHILREQIQNYAPKARIFIKEHSGIGATRNYGVKMATGDYLVFLDADDLLLPGYFPPRLEALKEVDFVAGAFLDFIHSKKQRDVYKVVHRDFLYGDSNIENIDKHDLFVTNSIMMKRELFFKAGGFPEGLVQGEDAVLWYKFIKILKAKMGYIHSPTCVYRHWSDNQAHYQAKARNLIDNLPYEEGIEKFKNKRYL